MTLFKSHYKMLWYKGVIIHIESTKKNTMKKDKVKDQEERKDKLKRWRWKKGKWWETEIQ
jgi:hypothetical protein